MENEILIRKRKMLLIAPLFFTPFLCLLFWTVGGGKGNETKVESRTGINTTIPKTTNNQVLQKDQAYRKLLEDSLRRLHLVQNDNYLYSNDNRPNAPYTVPVNPKTVDYPPANNQPYHLPVRNSRNSAEGDIDATLNDLKEKIAKSRTDYQQQQDNEQTQTYLTKKQELEEKKRQLEDFITQSKARSHLVDNMVSKDDGNKKQPMLKAEIKMDSVIYKLTPLATERPQERFYDGTTTGRPSNSGSIRNTISCMVAEDQTVTSGSVVKIRLTEDTQLGGAIVPKNTFLYATAQLQTERLGLNINNIQYGSSLYPVRLTVYDVDGIVGIRVPGGQDQVVVNQGKAGLANSGLSSLSGGLFINQSSNAGAQMLSQAGSSVLQTGQGILAHKLSIAKVFLKANYHILLKQSQ